MAEKIKLEIVTPTAQLLGEDVDEMTATGALGEFGVLPGHCAMLTSLKIGELSYKNGNEVKYLAVGGGYAEVGPDKVTILAETAEFSDQIDAERAQAALERAEEELKELAIDDKRYLEVQADAEKASLRLELSKRQ